MKTMQIMTPNVLRLTMLSIFAFFTIKVNAQVKVGNNPTTINSNAILEIESTNKGFLPPRVALTSTDSSSPLSAHVQGMVVYNTATSNDVVPALYVNNGTKWVKAVAPISTSTSNSNIVTLEVGQTAVYNSGPIAATSWANSALLSTINSSNPPITFEGLRMDVAKNDVNYWIPRVYNVSSTSAVTFTYNAQATVTYKVNGVKTTLPAGTSNFENIDGDGIVYWINNSYCETETMDIEINDKWYRAMWFGYQKDSQHQVRMTLTRLQ